jgi:hypothetical protein
MTKRNANTPVLPSVYAQLEAVKMTPYEREQAKQYLRRAEQIADLVTASAAGLKRLFNVAILKPVQHLRPRRGAGRPLSPAGTLGQEDLRTSQDVP